MIIKQKVKIHTVYIENQNCKTDWFLCLAGSPYTLFATEKPISEATLGSEC